ncbi:MAG: hypothetical protein ACR2PX_16760 [Endozoicomonas sp.]|uniref:hypothetical protein n=1 Tax=Endozoicomonas sp. TaxID=1892382 RepID=UPI003D9BBB28
MFTFKIHRRAFLLLPFLLFILDQAHSGLFPEIDFRPRIPSTAESLFRLPDLTDYSTMAEALRPKVVVPLTLDPDDPEQRPPSLEYMRTGKGHETMLEEHQKRIKERQDDLRLLFPFEQEPEDSLSIEDPHGAFTIRSLSVVPESSSEHDPEIPDKSADQDQVGLIQLMDPAESDNKPSNSDGNKEEGSSSEDESDEDAEEEESESDAVKSKELSPLEQHEKNLASLPAYVLKEPTQAYFSRRKHLAAMLIGCAAGLAATQGCSTITRISTACLMVFLTPTVMNMLLVKYAEIRRGSWSTAALIVNQFSKHTDEQGRRLWEHQVIPGLQDQILRLLIQWQENRSLSGGALMMEFFYIWAAWIEQMDSGNITEITEHHVSNIEAIFHTPEPRGEERANSDLQFNAEEVARQIAGQLPTFTMHAETDDSLFNLVNYVASLNPGFYLFNNLISPELLALAIVQRPYQDRHYYIFLAPHLSNQHFYTTNPEEVEALIRVLVDTLTDPSQNRRLSILRLIDTQNAMAAAAFPEPEESNEEDEEQ